MASAIQATSPAARTIGADRAQGREARATAAARDRLGRLPDAANPRQTAEQLVANLFFAPLLEEMRKMPFGNQFGNGGRGEEVFGQQLDNQVAAAAAASDPGGTVRKITEWIDRMAHGGQTAAGANSAAQELRSAGSDKATWQAALALHAPLAPAK